jgi:hypothetical protein
VRIITAAACLALLGGAVVYAQQPVEWRPNISEDNKTAGWDETATFLTQFIKTVGHGNHGDWYALDSSTPDRCSLRVLVRSYPPSRAELDLSEFTVDLKRLDPLTIRVNAEDGLTFAGTDDASLIKGSETVWLPHFDSKEHNYVDFSNVATMACPNQPTKNLIACTTSPLEKYTTTFFFESTEAARRYARALMHAALLCGGTKSVSPF